MRSQHNRSPDFSERFAQPAPQLQQDSEDSDLAASQNRGVTAQPTASLVQILDAKNALTIARIKSMIMARRNREQYFPPNMFADPAWDILLNLTLAELECRRVSVSQLCQVAAVPPTTALRWIQNMTDNGMLQRRSDSLDARRFFVEPTQSTLNSMMKYLHG
jgi:DNA-binding MarR family transcriptional regulator